MENYKDCETCKHCGKCTDEMADKCWSNNTKNYEPITEHKPLIDIYKE